MNYVNRNPGAKCSRCGKSIADRAKSTIYCADCAKLAAHDNAIKRKQLVHMLEERNKVMTPIQHKQSVSRKTGKEQTYYACPSCGFVLNKQDTFCRYCGQRMKEDVDE